MAVLEPPKPRSTLEEGPEGLRITIPVKAHPLFLCIAGLWIVMGIFGIVTMANHPRAGTERFPQEMFGPVILFSLFALCLILWNICRRQVVTVRAKVLMVRTEVMRIGRSREYDLQQVKNLRPAPTSGTSDWLAHLYRFPGFTPGSILFDYGARTFRFGPGIDEPEARKLIDAIQRHF